MKETTIQYIGLEKIRPSKTNPRKHFDENYITELSDSILAKGILQPLLARPDWCIGKTDEEIASVNGNGERADAAFFEIVAGECRYRGASKAKLTEAPAIIRLLSDKETLEIQLIENLQRSDLTAVEEAEAYRRLIDEMGYTVDLIHERTGKARNTIYGKLKMLRAPKLLLDALEKGIIGERLCELVGRIPIPEMRQRAAREILKPDFQEDPLNYRKASEHVSDNYMRALSGAQFDQNDAALIPTVVDEETGERIGGGACSDCPMKSGNRPELFGDLKRPDVCTNPKCFNCKTDAHFARLQKAAEAEGKKILSAEEAREIFENDNRLWFDSPYVKLSEQPDRAEVRADVKKIPSWKKLLENLESKPAIVIAPDPRGRIVELVDRGLAIEAVNLAAKQKGERSIFDLQKPRAGSRSVESGEDEPEWKKQERKNREIAKVNFKISLAAMEALIGAIDKRGMIKGFWDNLIELAIFHSGHDGHWFICKRLGLDPKAVKKKGPGSMGHEEAVREYAGSLSEEFKPGFVVELLMSRELKWCGSRTGPGSVERFDEFTKLYKIDVPEIEKRLRAELKEKAKPRKASLRGKNLSGGVPVQRANRMEDGGVEAVSAPPAQHKFQKIAGIKYRCKNCGAAAVKNKGAFVLANEFRGKPCIATEKPRKASQRDKKCSRCSSTAQSGKSMCEKCLAKNAARAKARRAKKGGVK
jgi:ParB/RepB/Spo0J family partition protein